MPLRRIGEKIIEGKNDSSVSTQNFLIIYIFGIRSRGNPGLRNGLREYGPRGYVIRRNGPRGNGMREHGSRGNRPW
jgi:hypothetical protein